MNILKATRQWATRPADERFESLQELHDACKAYADTAKEKDVSYQDLRTEAQTGEVVLVGKANIPAKLTHWAFGQLCQRIAAPASYLRDLPATLACQNLNHGLAQRVSDGLASLLFHNGDGLLLRALTSQKYERIWNWEIADRLLGLNSLGWEPAKPDIRFDGGDPTQCQACGGSGGECPTCRGTGRAFPALYASDHDMFAFLRNPERTITEPGNPDGLQRGIIVENSEVGAAALKLTRFLYRQMCGNHIIWGTSRVLEISIRHVGRARGRWNYYASAIRRYADESTSEEEAIIAQAKRKLIAATKDEVLDALFGKRSVGLPYKTLEAGYEANVPDQDGDPRTPWGIVQGLTRHSQTIPYADQRNDVDKAAGRILKDFSF